MISYVDQKLFFLNIGGSVKGVVHVKSNKVLKIVDPEVFLFNRFGERRIKVI